MSSLRYCFAGISDGLDKLTKEVKRIKNEKAKLKVSSCIEVFCHYFSVCTIHNTGY